MRTFRTILLIPVVAFSAYFLFGYARAIYTLYEPPHGIGLLGVPHVCAWRPWIPSFKASGGISLFLASDPPEGTMLIFRLPSWPFALATGGVLIYAGYILFDCRKKPVA